MARWIGIVVGVLLFAGLAYWLFRPMPTESPAPEAPTPVQRPTPEREPATPERPVRPEPDPSTAARTPTEPVPAPDLPPLAESDAFVRDRLEPFPMPREWVAQDDLVRRAAVVLDNATRGDIPRRRIRFVEPQSAFRVVERDGRLYGHPDNPRRFDGLIDRLESIEPAAVARLVRGIEPLLDEAFAELGRPPRSLASLRETIDRVLDMPAPPEDPELVQRKVLYEYADPDLEAMEPVEKQLVRLGPENLKRLQAWLRDLRAALR